MSDKQYYNVPVTMEEIHLLQFTNSQNVVDYFKKLLSSKRPDQLATPFLLFEQDDSYPDELFGIVYDETGTVLHFLYISSKTMIYPSLKKFKVIHKFHLNLPQFENFKRENSHLHTLFKDKSIDLPLILDDHSLPLEKNRQLTRSSSTPMDAMINTVMVLFIILCFYLLRYKKQPTPSFQNIFKEYIQKIHNPNKRKKLIHLLHSIKDPQRKSVLVQYLQDPLVIDFLNEKLQDENVVKELEKFIHSLPDNTKPVKLFKKLIEEKIFTKKEYPMLTQPSKQQTINQIIITTPQKVKKQFTMDKLYQFLKNNKQTIVSVHGAVSPHFLKTLQQFLKQENAPNPQEIKHFVMSHAVPLAKTNKTHRQVTDYLLHLLTQQRSLQSLPPSISPTRKSSARRRIKTVVPQDFDIIKQQQKTIEQNKSKPSQDWIELVQRIAKPKQTLLGSDVLNVNIQNILQTSKTFRKIVPTLCRVIKSRQIHTIYVVDAPNLLTPLFTTYKKRQHFSSSLQFVKMINKHMEMDQNALVLIVAQMNKTEWKNEDPIYFGRIGDDEENIFLVRVGCFDGSINKDCYRSFNTNFHNECDDFVRLDVMARILYTLKQNDEPIPTIIHITNDKNRNWQFNDTFFSQTILSFPLSLSKSI